MSLTIDRAELRCETSFKSAAISKAAIRRTMLSRYGGGSAGKAPRVTIVLAKCEKNLCNDHFPTEKQKGREKIRESAEGALPTALPSALPTDKVPSMPLKKNLIVNAAFSLIHATL